MVAGACSYSLIQGSCMSGNMGSSSLGNLQQTFLFWFNYGVKGVTPSGCG